MQKLRMRMQIEVEKAPCLAPSIARILGSYTRVRHVGAGSSSL